MILNRNKITILLRVALLLLIPLISMQFTDEVNWSLFDFLVAGFLLFGTGFLFEFVWIKVEKRSHKILISILVSFALTLMWAELAVGVFGTPFAGN